MLHAMLACMILIFHARGRGHEENATFRARLRLTYPARRAIVERILVGIGGYRGCCSDAMAGIQWVGEVQGVEPWRVRELRQAPHRGKRTDHDVQPSDAPPPT